MIDINKYVNVSEKRMNLIERIASIVMGDLKLNSSIELNINPSNEMEGCDGFCYSHRKIDIVNKRAVEELFKVIAHEIRHCYQFKNDLIDCDGKWRGKRHLFSNGESDGAEVDAVRYENKMWKKYKSLIKKS